MAKLINPMLEPKYAYGPAPTYTKCDASTGYNPNAKPPTPPTPPPPSSP
jgi:hypothetical protein